MSPRRAGREPLPASSSPSRKSLPSSSSTGLERQVRCLSRDLLGGRGGIVLRASRRRQAIPERQEGVRRLRRRRGGAHDRAIILTQVVEPRAEVVGMAHGRNDAESRANVCRADLGTELLLEVYLRAEGTGQIAVEAVAGPPPVAELVSQCTAKIYGLEERPRRRDADEVAGHVVVGPVAADADVGACGADQRL